MRTQFCFYSVIGISLYQRIDLYISTKYPNGVKEEFSLFLLRNIRLGRFFSFICMICRKWSNKQLTSCLQSLRHNSRSSHPYMAKHNAIPCEDLPEWYRDKTRPIEWQWTWNALLRINYSDGWNTLLGSTYGQWRRQIGHDFYAGLAGLKRYFHEIDLTLPSLPVSWQFVRIAQPNETLLLLIHRPGWDDK